ncbi:hypothetical protein KV679_16720 [Bacillus sp. JRC01]|nr:hypothetical protein [Bacillus sp. JRC01]
MKRWSLDSIGIEGVALDALPAGKQAPAAKRNGPHIHFPSKENKIPIHPVLVPG